MSAPNPYQDASRASGYAEIGIVNTYYLAYRDLPAIFGEHRISGAALDFGCGAGRSTRFLQGHGFSTVGVDISDAMVLQARERDPGGDYRVIAPGSLRTFPDRAFDLVLSVMPFESMATLEEMVEALTEICRVLKPGGWKVVVASSRDMYVHEWVSFSTANFLENRTAQDGDTVRTLINDIGDRRAVEDVLWTEGAYRKAFARTPLDLVATRHPVSRPEDDYQCDWISERTTAPWVVFVLRKPG